MQLVSKITNLTSTIPILQISYQRRIFFSLFDLQVLQPKIHSEVFNSVKNKRKFQGNLFSSLLHSDYNSFFPEQIHSQRATEHIKPLFNFISSLWNRESPVLNAWAAAWQTASASCYGQGEGAGYWTNGKRGCPLSHSKMSSPN